MFFQLLWIEWIRLSRRPLLWLTLAACALYTGLSLANFYNLNRLALTTHQLKMPGASFDLANSLDQLLIAIPFLVIVAGNMMGNDYSQRTNQHWLMRAPRATSLLAKLVVLILLTIGVQVLTLLVGYGVGFYYKYYIYGAANVLNINWLATAAAPFYMTLVNLPYLAVTLLLAICLRSTFFSVVLSLAYTQVLEYLVTGIFFGASWTRWLFTNLHFSASFLLNSIGNRAAQLPTHILPPTSALLTAAAYSLVLLALAALVYRHQDVGG